MLRVAFSLAVASLCAGCVTTEAVSFRPRAEQQSLVRDGHPALVSRKKNSIVLIRPAARELQAGARPVFVVGITSLSNQPLDFRIGTIEATQVVHGQPAALRVITYEDLVAEERNRQVAQAILVGMAAGANAWSASQAGHYRSTTTVHTRRGTYVANTSGYSPTAAAIAQSNAAAQNEAMISATIERGQQNLAMLEQGVMKDNTILPGEWYGGQLHLQPLASTGSEPKTYQISLLVGSDRHDVEVVQGAKH